VINESRDGIEEKSPTGAEKWNCKERWDRRRGEPLSHKREENHPC